MRQRESSSADHAVRTPPGGRDAAAAPINVLTFTTLYPNPERPYHGIFVEARLRHLLHRHPNVKPTVVAPVPWFPFSSRRFGTYARYARVPREEQRNGIRVLHPRYLLIPKVGMNLAPLLMCLSVFPVLRRIVRRSESPFHLIDAHYFYPDGVAAVMLGRMLRLPVSVTARGTDINLIPRWAAPRAMIRWAARHAARVITVCEALQRATAELEQRAHITVLRNGVDLTLFAPAENRDEVRRTLGFERYTLLCVGHLIERKGPALVLDALSRLPDVDLVFVGEGELRRSLEKQARALGVEARVRFTGTLDQERLKVFYQAADGIVLASSREGWANVLLEAMACGTPVVATRVWGTPEVVEDGVSGFLIEQRSPEAIAAAIARLRSAQLDRSKVRAWAERFSWDDTSDGLLDVFDQVSAGRAAWQKHA